MRTLISGIALLALVMISGCATFQNTPAQDRTYARFEVCRQHYPQYQLVRVREDGWWWIQPSDPSVGEFAACMNGGKGYWK